MTVSELQDILNKAVASTASYNADASKVVDDKKVLANDEGKAAASVAVARDDVKAASDALAELFATFPVAPVPEPAPVPPPVVAG